MRTAATVIQLHSLQLTMEYQPCVAQAAADILHQSPR
jgi:hypothetical protein